MKKRSFFQSVLFLIILLFSIAVQSFAAAEIYTAATMRLLRYEGTVEIEDEEGESRFVMENARFNSGETMHTGEESLASVSLDTTKIVTMDEKSSVQFEQDGDSLALTLKEGSLLLDVQEKLDENESLDIETSTMVVGIRGTVVDVQLEKSESAANDTGGETTKLDVLEGNVEGSYLDPNGVKKIFQAKAGQRVTFIDQDGDHCPDRTPEVKDLAYNEIPEFVKQVIQNDLRMENRIRSGSDLMDRPLKFTNEVTFIAQSASKLYDGQALTRSGDVLVTGLPEGFSYTAYAIGSQTEAGSSSNQVTSYHIYDTEKTEVTSDFTDIKTVDGTLVVDPALVTVWTGSAEKVYDGTPLVNPDALLRFTAGYQKGQTVWRNLSYNLTEEAGTQTLYGICGETLVHGTNPLTMDTQELILHAGQKLVVCLHEKGEEEGSIEFEIKTLKEEEIPESILRLYANNPDLLEQALKDTEWDKEIIEKLIRKLPESVEEPILQDTLLVEKDDSDKLLKDCTNVKITIDTDVTEYYDRPLEREEAHFLPVALNPDITVKATGSQTEPGSSKNSYTIDWGNEKASNYTLKEDLGTLTVHPLNTYEDPVTFTAASARKVYDGTALEVKHVTADGLPDGFTFKANVEGSQTSAGKSENTIRSFQIFDKDKEDVTSRFTNVLLESGVLEVEELKLQVDYGAAEESYYGDFQLSPPVVMYLNGTHAGEEVHGVYLKSKERIVLYTLFTRDQFRLTIRGGDSRPGTYTLTGSFDFLSGNSVNYNFSSWIRASYTIHPRTAVVTTGSATKVYDGTPLVNTEASITGLADEDTAVVTATGSITEVGSTTNTYTIDWRYTDKDCYILKENLGTLTVTAPETYDDPVTLTAASASKTYDGTPLTDDSVSISGLPEGFTVTAAASGSQTDAGSSANVVEDDYVIRNAEGEDKTSYFTDVKRVDGILTVDPKAVTVTTGSASKIYDGTALTNTEATIDGLVNGESVTLTAVGTITEIGTTQNNYTIIWDNAKESNYTITENLGMLSVTAPEEPETYDDPVILTAASASKTYDGTALTDSSVTASGLPEGFTVEATASGSQTDAGSSANVVDSYLIKNAEGEDKTESFTNVTKVEGTLTVDPKAVTITTGNASKAYDGTALTNSEATIEGLAEGESVTLSAAGTITEIGTTENNYTITWDKAKASNYTISENLGTLTIVGNSSEILLTAASVSKTYDGTALTENNVTATGLPEGFTIEATAIGSQTAAGSSTNEVETYVIKNAEGEDKTACFTNVKKVDGTLTVNPKAVTITAGSDTKVYDGTALSKDSYTSTTLIEGDSIASVTVTGSQTVVGTSDNVPSAAVIKNAAGEDVTANYEITYAKGTLEVTKKTVTITAGSDTKVYDGTALSKESYTSTALTEGDSLASVTVTGSQTIAGTSDNVPSAAVIKNAAGEDVTESYKITYTNGTLEVTKKALTITAASDTKVYDGTELTKDSYTNTALAEGDSFDSVAVTGSQTVVGTSDNVPSAAVIRNASGEDVTLSYEITYNDGTLEVTRKALTITAASDTKVYDGTALTIDSYTNTALAKGDNINSVTVTGRQTVVGESDNVPSAAVIKNAANEDVTASYEITYANGTLKVTQNQELIITADSETKVYDGTALTKNSYQVAGLGAGDSVKSVTITGSQTTAGKSDNIPSAARIENAGGEDVTSNYEITYANGTLEVTKKAVTITADSDTKIYDGTPLTKDSYTSTALAEGDSIASVAITGSQTVMGTSDNLPSAAAIKNVSGEDVTANYEITYVKGTLEVTKRAVTITADSESKVYDGTALTKDSYTNTALVEGDSIASVKVTGSQTVVGTSDNVPGNAMIVNADEDDVTSNYEITYAKGTLEVTKKSVTITAENDTKVYDGTELTKDSYTNTTLAEGDSFNSVTITGTQTVVGTSDNVPSAAVIMNASGEDVTSSYEITYTNGTLEVTKKALTITAASDTKVYEGSALTKDSYTNTALAEGDSFQSVTVTGSQTVVGTSDNVPSEALIVNEGKEDVTASYEITYVNGTLHVTKKAITITADNDSKVYDGTALTKDSYTNTALAGGDSLASVKVTGSQTIVGTSNNVPSMAVIKNSDDEDVTDSYEITYANGTLEVTKKTVTITAESGTKVYDGNPLTKDSYTNTALAAGDTFKAVTVTGSQTVAGTSDNVPSDAKIVNAAGTDVTASYEITYANGTLEVTKKTVTITAGSGMKVYDGSPLTKNSYTNTDLAVGDSIDSVTVTGSQTVAGTSDNVPSEAMIINVDENDVTANYEITYSNGALEVTKKAVTITADSSSKVYDGIALTKGSYTNTDLAVGDSIQSVTITGSQTVTGTSNNVPSAAVIKNTSGADVTASYEITYANGKLEVTKKAVTITAGSDTKEYDGSALTKDNYTSTSLAVGDIIESVTVTGSQTVVGDSDNKPSAAVIKNASGVDVTASYEITYANGTLKVTKKAVTITADSDSKPYNGISLVKNSYTYTELAAGDSIESVTVTGSQTIVGKSDNVPSAALIKNASGENMTANYEITYANGTLEVTKKTVTITAGSKEKEYDGTLLTENSYTSTELAAGDSIESVTVTGSRTIAGKAANVPSAAVIKNASGENVTANYEIIYANGTLEVTKKAVTIKAGSKEKEYDGTLLTENSYTITELAPGDSIESVTVTGSRKIAGEAANVPSAAVIMNASNENVTANYEITYANGKLEVTKKAVTITAGSNSKEYDGTLFTDNSYTNTELAAGDSIESVTVTADSLTEVGKTDNVPSAAVIKNSSDEDVTANYEITYANGTLEVIPLKIEFDLRSSETFTDPWYYYSDDPFYAETIVGTYITSETELIPESFSMDEANASIYAEYNLTGGGKVKVSCGHCYITGYGEFYIPTTIQFLSGEEYNYHISVTGNRLEFIEIKGSGGPDEEMGLHTKSLTKNAPVFVQSGLFGTVTFSEPSETPMPQEPSEIPMQPPVPSETPAPLVAPSETPMPSVVLTITPTPFPVISVTPTPIPESSETMTPIPSETPTPKLSEVLTPVPSETPKPVLILSETPTPILSGMELMTK